MGDDALDSIIKDGLVDEVMDVIFDNGYMANAPTATTSKRDSLENLEDIGIDLGI